MCVEHRKASDVGFSGTSLLASLFASRAKPNQCKKKDDEEVECTQLNERMGVGDKIGMYSTRAFVIRLGTRL